MTLQMNMNATTLLEDLAVITVIVKCDNDEQVISLKKHMTLKNFSTIPYSRNNVPINVTIEEFSLIMIFNSAE